MGTSAMCDSPFPRSRGGVGGDLNPGRALELEKIGRPRAVALFPKNLPTPTSASRCWPRIRVTGSCPVPPLCSAGTPSWPHGPENTSPWLAPQGSPPHPVPFIPASESPDVVAPYGVWTHWPAPSGRSSPSMWPPGPESAGCMDSARTWRSPRRGPHHYTQGPRSSPVPTPKPPRPWGCKPFNSCRCSPLIGAIDRWTEPQ